MASSREAVGPDSVEMISVRVDSLPVEEDNNNNMWWSWSLVLDWAVVVVLGIILIVVYTSVPPISRVVVPNDSSLMYPLVPAQTVPTWLLLLLVVLLPALAMLSILLLQRFFIFAPKLSNMALAHNIHHTTLCFAFVCISVLLLTEVLKVSIGRKRPNYFASTGGVSDEFSKSWPSGHTSLAFGALSMFSLWCGAKAGVLDPERRAGQLWLTLLCFGPGICVASFIAASRTFDMWHDFSDINTGIIIGLVLGIFGFLQFFRPSNGEPINRARQKRKAK